MAYEKMPCLYDTQKDLMDRLHGTIVRYKGHPYMVLVRSEKKLDLADTVTQEIQNSCSPNDPDLDISSAEIGYMNYKPSTTIIRYHDRALVDKVNCVNYLERTPRRMYRQGLFAECLLTYKVDGKGGISAEPLLTLEGFRASLVGEFPSFDLALTLIESEGWEEAAISQTTALKKTESGLILVFYRCRNVGWIPPGSNAIEVPMTEKQWVIKRMLENEGLEVSDALG